MKRQHILPVVSIVIALLLPLIMPNLYALSILTLMAVYAISATGINFGYGFGGQISWGQAAFMGVGAYITAIASVTLHWPTLIAFVVAVIGSIAVGLLIGWPTTRMSGHYLAIATIGLVIVVGNILSNWKQVTKGAFGIAKIPPIGITETWSLHSPIAVSYVILAFLGLGILVLRRIIQSPFGLMIKAMRDDIVAAQTFGVTRSRYNSLTFAISAAYGGVAGALYAHVFGYISPDTYNLDLSVGLFTMVLVGGAGTYFGPIIGSVIFTLIPQVLSSFGSWIYVIEGLIIVLFIVLKPNGLATIFSDASRRFGKRDTERKETHVSSSTS
jgi:branched-chain amino acid transport system permease protein